MATKSLHGYLRLRVTSAHIPGALALLTEQNIMLYDISLQDDLTALLTISRRDYKKTTAILEKRGDRCDAANRFGFYWTLLTLKKRWLFVFSCFIILFLTFYIPSKILFFEVKGNHSIEEKWILEKAQQSGLTFGSKRATIKSEKMKNSILEKIPELDWVGITTAGCVATIEVREKPVDKKTEDNLFCVSHMVATCDSVIENATATAGTLLCKPGQAVEKGQVLISGYENCGFVIKATKAQGEIFGRTIRTLNLISPTNGQQRGQNIGSEKKYSLQIGKNIINFSKDSGISPPGCVKMYSRKYLTLPGGFQLPIAWVCQELLYYDCLATEDIEEDAPWLEQYAQQYLFTQMNAGEILLQETAVQLQDGCYVFTGVYACREQIGRIKIEEILNQNGKYSGTDR